MHKIAGFGNSNKEKKIDILTAKKIKQDLKATEVKPRIPPSVPKGAKRATGYPMATATMGWVSRCLFLNCF